MGMSTHVVGFIPPDAEWQKKKAAWEACEAAGVPVPDELQEFFGDEQPDDLGREVEIPKRRWSGRESEGYEVDLEALPPGVKVIRFFNSW